MGRLRLRNCTIWDVHYWRELGNSTLVVKPGEEGTYDWGATYTLGVKRVNLSPPGPDGIHYRHAVYEDGIYYVVWNASIQKLDILNEHDADLYQTTPDNEHIKRWIKRFPNWMSLLDGNHLLSKYSIPGTHDSGTKNTGHGPAHTQNFGIYAQLADGIRFLDIRLDAGVTPFDPELVVKHSCILCFLSFESVLNDCKRFLIEHPGETIIMLVNKSGCVLETIGASFRHYLEKPEYAGLFHLKEEIPLLKDVRGKIVLLRRFSYDRGPMGVDLSKGWKNNETFTLKTPQSQWFKIEDQYKVYNTQEKLSVVEKSLNAAISNPKDNYMYITYNSIGAGDLHTPYQYAWGGNGINRPMNYHLNLFLQTRSGNRRFGVVILDFYNDKGSQNGIVEMLVKSNDGLKLKK